MGNQEVSVISLGICLPLLSTKSRLILTININTNTTQGWDWQLMGDIFPQIPTVFSSSREVVVVQHLILFHLSDGMSNVQ